MMPKLEEVENEHFDMVISKKGLKSSDFELTYQREPIHGLEYAVKGHVTVKRKSTGKHNTYKIGHSLTSWTVDFEQDLNRGVFD